MRSLQPQSGCAGRGPSSEARKKVRGEEEGGGWSPRRRRRWRAKRAREKGEQRRRERADVGQRSGIRGGGGGEGEAEEKVGEGRCRSKKGERTLMQWRRGSRCKGAGENGDRRKRRMPAGEGAEDMDTDAREKGVRRRRQGRADSNRRRGREHRHGSNHERG